MHDDSSETSDDCDTPASMRVANLFEIVWKDEKYGFCLYIFEGVGLMNRSAALGSMSSSELFPGGNSMLPR
jgi:hypothetical protein